MQILDILQLHPIDEKGEPVKSGHPFSDLCEKEFFLTFCSECQELSGLSYQIQNLLKTEGPEAADRKYGTEILEASSRIPFHCLSEKAVMTSVASEDYPSAIEAMGDCLSKISEIPGALVWNYDIEEKKKGLFSRKSFVCTVNYAMAQFSDFEKTTKNIARAFLEREIPDEKKALEYLRFCNLQDPEVQLLIAGISIVSESEKEQMLAKAKKEFQKRAEKNDVKAWGYYAKLILSEQPIKASRYAEMAASSGQPEGYYVKGLCLEQGIGTFKKDLVEARKCYESAAAYGHIESQYSLGRICETPEESFRYYKLAADKGHAEAQYRIGCAYEYGNGVARDIMQAVHFYKLAADRGIIPAMVSVGKAYETGSGTVKNQELAKCYFKKAAEHGDTEARYEIGRLYAATGATKADQQEAFRYFRLAAEGGHAEAQYWTSVYEIEGKGTKKSTERAVRWMINAAEQGNERALKKLLEMEQRGLLSPEQKEKYFYCLKKAADEGSVMAQAKVGRAYEKGDSVECDPEQAFFYYKAAADRGLKEAQYKIGCRYQERIGTISDTTEAMKYFKLAADQGHEKAAKKMKEVAEQLLREEKKERLCKEIMSYHKTKAFEPVFRILRQEGAELQEKEEAQTVLKSFIEHEVQLCADTYDLDIFADNKNGAVNKKENIAAYLSELPEQISWLLEIPMPEAFYDVAVSFEKEKRMLHAINAYLCSAMEGNGKAANALKNMAVNHTRYFIALDETYLK